MSVPIRVARRSIDGPGAFELQLTDGHVLHAVAFGAHPDEQARTREAILAALAASGIAVAA